MSSKKFRIIKNPDKERVSEVVAGLSSNDGHCPCVLFHDEDTKCMCKEFREKEDEGFCRCKLFYKKKI